MLKFNLKKIFGMFSWKKPKTNTEPVIDARVEQVIRNSETLQNALGLNSNDLKDICRSHDIINCGEYDIVVSNRCFHYWILVMEIVPTGNYAFNPDAPWVRSEDRKGTCSVNLAPKEVLNEVLFYIKNKM